MKLPLIRRHRAVPLALALTIGLIAPSLPAPRPALAAGQTFTVNTSADSNGACDPLPGDCSLREAINAANGNANDEADTIAFDIPGQGVQTIRPAFELPAIRSSMTIDGYTQSGAQQNSAEVGTNAVLLIELDGSQAGLASGLVNGAGGLATIRGLVINNFSVTGIRSEGPNLSVQGSFIGTNAAGTAARPNSIAGVLVDGPPGETLAVIGARGQSAKRNLISGNGGGIAIGQASIQIANNLIGTDRTGTQPLGNERFGISTRSGGQIAENTIAFGEEDGIRVLGNNVFIRRNAIFGNGDLGIDLGDDGPTANDPADADLGANSLQNFPDITSATTPQVKKKKGKKGNKSTTTTIVGTLNSLPNLEYEVALFANPGNGVGDGTTFLDERRLTTDADGNVGFTVVVDSSLKGQTITATATNVTNGETSEFSEPVTVKQVKKDKKRKKGKKSSLAPLAIESPASAVGDQKAKDKQHDNTRGHGKKAHAKRGR